MARIHFTGDSTLDQYVYVTRPASAPDARETWANAAEVLSFEVHGAAGGARDALRTVSPGLGVTEAALSCVPVRPPRSLFLLREEKGRWAIETPVLTGQEAARRALGTDPCPDPHDFEPGQPLVVLDYEQGWTLRHEALLPKLLSGRPSLIRSQDPAGAYWRRFREAHAASASGERTWFANLQDLAGGSIQAPGTWKDVRERAVAHLTRDPTLWDGARWRESVVLQIQQDGMLLLPRGGDRLGELYVVAQAQPGSLSREGFGNVAGSGILLVGSLAQPLAERGEYSHASLREAVQAGLRRMRAVIRAGHRPPSKAEAPPHRFCDGLDRPHPADEVVAYRQPVPDLATAEAIVDDDESVFRRATVLKLGNLITADEEYAGTLLGLFSRLKNHLKSGKKVLSFAVFGGPGSGKSMVAKQIAKVLDPEGRRFEPVEFNLSQFDRPERLTAALRQVEKIGHKGRVPLVLWDEFDGALDRQPRGWLSHFLMPMQDAEFFDGGEVRRLPEKCVFVFIGGTFKTGARFKTWALGEEGAALKGRDFHSRLDRCLDIADLELVQDGERTPPSLNVPNMARLRRAVLLRHWLNHDYPRVRRIDSNVLAWLLHVPLAHGTRSLEGILKASELGQTEDFQAHHLPSREMLQLHLREELPPGDFLADLLRQAGGSPEQSRVLELAFRGNGR